MKKYIAILLLIPIFFLYKSINSTYITATFKDLRPFHSNIPVYYKGIKIGRAKDIRHSNDYQHTLLRIQLYGRKHKLPTNTKVYLKKEIRGKRHYDYLELIMPDTPESTFLKNGSWIEGKCSVDIEHFLRNQDPDDIENLRANIVQASENLNNTLESVAGLFAMGQDILSENRPTIKKSVNNVETATNKINNVISEKQLSTTFTNIENATAKTYSITENFSDTGMSGINGILVKTNCILDDTNCITQGVRKTMSKRFGGLRLMFGKVVD